MNKKIIIIITLWTLSILCVIGYGIKNNLFEIKTQNYQQSSNFVFYQRSDIQCLTDDDCNHGTCVIDANNPVFNECICDDGFTDRNGRLCNYEQRLQLVAVLLSLFVGWTGIHWFYIAVGNGLYIFAGVAQIVTCNFCCIGGLAVFILFMFNAIADGNNIELATFGETP